MWCEPISIFRIYKFIDVTHPSKKAFFSHTGTQINPLPGFALNAVISPAFNFNLKITAYPL